MSNYINHLKGPGYSCTCVDTSKIKFLKVYDGIAEYLFKQPDNFTSNSYDNSQTAVLFGYCHSCYSTITTIRNQASLLGFLEILN